MPHTPSQTSVQHHMNFSNIGYQPRGSNHNYSNMYNNTQNPSNHYHNPYSYNGSSYNHSNGYNHNENPYSNNYYPPSRGNTRMKNGSQKPFYPKNNRNYEYHHSRKSNSPYSQTHHRQQHEYNLSYQPYGGYQPFPHHQIMPQIAHISPQHYMDDQRLPEDSLPPPVLFNTVLSHMPHPQINQPPDPLISNDPIMTQSPVYSHRFAPRLDASSSNPHLSQSPEPSLEPGSDQFVQIGGTFSSQLPWLSVPDQAFPKRRFIRKHRVQEKLKQIQQSEETEETKEVESEDRAEPKQDIEVVDEADASLDLAESSNVPEQPTEEPVKSLSSQQSSPSSSSFSLLKASKPSSEDLLPALSPPSATKSWAEKLKASPSKTAVSSQKKPNGTKSVVAPANGESSKPSKPVNGSGSGQAAFSETKGSVTKDPIGVVLASFDYENVCKSYGQNRIARGMANSGNICFMNSILQVLIHCSPFFKFLQYAEKNSIFRIKSETPLMDAMIELSRELSKPPGREPNMSSGVTEINNQPISPEAFYSVVRSQPPFKHYKRGRQEDAEEFLGYLLESLHDEFLAAMKSSAGLIEGKEEEGDESEWLEVGKNNKGVTVQQNAGFGKTPISQLFAGNLRSTLNVPSKKPSITREPFQQIQLDISDPDVHSIEDAFVNLTKPEKLQYSTSSQQEVRATKQILIDDTPEILVAHLKRFSYTIEDTKEYQSIQEQVRKISKSITYPSRLEIPRECFTAAVATPSPPTYTLSGVVYHHGPSATSGHYTADVKIVGDNGREEWINIDDISLNKISAPKDLVQSKQRGNGGHMNNGSTTMAAALGSKAASNGHNKARHASEDSEGTLFNGVASPVSNMEASESTKTAYILFYTKDRVSLSPMFGTDRE